MLCCSFFVSRPGTALLTNERMVHGRKGPGHLELGMLIPGYLDTRVPCGLPGSQPGSRKTSKLPSYRDGLHQSNDCPSQATYRLNCCLYRFSMYICRDVKLEFFSKSKLESKKSIKTRNSFKLSCRWGQFKASIVSRRVSLIAVVHLPCLMAALLLGRQS